MEVAERGTPMMSKTLKIVQTSKAQNNDKLKGMKKIRKKRRSSKRKNQEKDLGNDLPMTTAHCLRQYRVVLLQIDDNEYEPRLCARL